MTIDPSRPLSPWQRRVLDWFEDRLAADPNPQQTVVVSLRTVADDLGTSRFQVYRSVKALEQRSLLLRTARYYAAGDRDASAYTVLPASPTKLRRIYAVAETEGLTIPQAIAKINDA